MARSEWPLSIDPGRISFTPHKKHFSCTADEMPFATTKAELLRYPSLKTFESAAIMLGGARTIDSDVSPAHQQGSKQTREGTLLIKWLGIRNKHIPTLIQNARKLFTRLKLPKMQPKATQHHLTSLLHPPPSTLHHPPSISPLKTAPQP